MDIKKERWLKMEITFKQCGFIFGLIVTGVGIGILSLYKSINMGILYLILGIIL